MFHNVWFKDNNLSSGISNTCIRVCMRRLFILCDLSMTSKHDKPLLGSLDQVLELGSAIFNHTKGSNSSLPWNKSFVMLIFKRKKEWVIFILLRINYMRVHTQLANILTEGKHMCWIYVIFTYIRHLRIIKKFLTEIYTNQIKCLLQNQQK